MAFIGGAATLAARAQNPPHHAGASAFSWACLKAIPRDRHLAACRQGPHELKLVEGNGRSPGHQYVADAGAEDPGHQSGRPRRAGGNKVRVNLKTAKLLGLTVGAPQCDQGHPYRRHVR